MKSFFEDLGKKIGETTETVTSKAGEMMEIQRLRGQIRTLERGNEADMLEMGRFLYEKYQAGEAMDEQVQMLCEKIDNRTESIERHQAKIKEISEIKGKRYAEYYYFILLGAKTTYIFTILIFVCLLAVLAASVEALLLGLLLGGLAIAYLDLSLQDKLTARRQELVLDLPQVLSKLTLLVNSGMVLRDAWKRVSVTGDRALYQEMQNTSMEIENGIMETDAYRNFAERCNVKEIRKFASLVIQNLKKGNEELAYFLKDLSDEMWEVKKNEVKQKGEKANSRLLLPMMLIFIGILIMILVPVFQQMG